jgi:DNA-binding NtrC family response regulator
MTIIYALWFPEELFSQLRQMMALRTNVTMVASESEALALSEVQEDRLVIVSGMQPGAPSDDRLAAVGRLHGFRVPVAVLTASHSHHATWLASGASTCIPMQQAVIQLPIWLDRFQHRLGESIGTSQEATSNALWEVADPGFLADQKRDLMQEWAGSEGLGPFISQIQALVGRSGPVCLVGERGVGKSLIARWIHQQSPWSIYPFMGSSVEYLDPERSEKAIFGGIVEGDGGADQQRYLMGWLDFIQGGTLYMESCQLLAPLLQKRLADWLERQKSLHVDGANAGHLVFGLREQSGAFPWESIDSDLLAWMVPTKTTRIPPLREFAPQIPTISRTVLSWLAVRRNKPVPRLTKAAKRLLMQYPWPGNLAQLQEVLEATLDHCDHQIEEVHLSLWLDLDDQDPDNPQNLDEAAGGVEEPSAGEGAAGRYRLDDPPSGSTAIPSPRFLADPVKREEFQRIHDALTRCKGNRSRAAKELGISRVTLYKKLRYYGIVSSDEGPEAGERLC